MSVYKDEDFDALIEYAEQNQINLDALSEEELEEAMAKVGMKLKLKPDPRKEVGTSMAAAREFLKKRKEERKKPVNPNESLQALFGDQQLSEEFKEKASTIFEAAVVLKTQEIEKQLTERFEAEFSDKAEEIMEELVEKVDGYLDLMVEQWFEQNQIALESGMKLEIFENFVGGMKALFQECYIEVPEEKADVFAQLEEKVEELQTQLNESVEHRIALKTEIESLKKAKVIEESMKGLTDLDAEKLKALAEDVVYESQEAFAKKLEVIKESFFANTAPEGDVKAVVTDSPVIEEEVKPSASKTELSESVQHFIKALDLLSIK